MRLLNGRLNYVVKCCEIPYMIAGIVLLILCALEIQRSGEAWSLMKSSDVLCKYNPPRAICYKPADLQRTGIFLWVLVGLSIFGLLHHNCLGNHRLLCREKYPNCCCKGIMWDCWNALICKCGVGRSMKGLQSCCRGHLCSIPGFLTFIVVTVPITVLAFLSLHYDSSLIHPAVWNIDNAKNFYTALDRAKLLVVLLGFRHFVFIALRFVVFIIQSTLCFGCCCCNDGYHNKNENEDNEDLEIYCSYETSFDYEVYFIRNHRLPDFGYLKSFEAARDQQVAAVEGRVEPEDEVDEQENRAAWDDIRRSAKIQAIRQKQISDRLARHILTQMKEKRFTS